MARKDESKNDRDSLGTVGVEKAFQRIANLLALLLVKGEGETEKVATLTAVGYTPAEIAKLLNKRAGTVRVLLHTAKRGSRQKDKR